jgi:hypothetical protein
VIENVLDKVEHSYSIAHRTQKRVSVGSKFDGSLFVDHTA